MRKDQKIPKTDSEQGRILNINKPVGKTSFDVVRYVRKLTGIKKVGHAGSLDPNATGILLIAVGKATKKIELLMGLEKEYIGTITLGVETETYDIEGKVVETKDTSSITLDQIREALLGFSGTIQQVPPVYSALKYKGKPLYSYARKGIDIKPEPRSVNIYKMEFLSYREPEIVIRAVCSRGTYIRSIAHDLGKTLGVGGMLSALSRVRIGEYCIEDSLNWEDLPRTAEELY
ncbi:tRNA pseudouridine(55) synthase TruB [candidate division KSB1 bacterium]